MKRSHLRLRSSMLNNDQSLVGGSATTQTSRNYKTPVSSATFWSAIPFQDSSISWGPASPD
jgi:hypothetical protein